MKFYSFTSHSLTINGAAETLLTGVIKKYDHFKRSAAGMGL